MKFNAKFLTLSLLLLALILVAGYVSASEDVAEGLFEGSVEEMQMETIDDSESTTNENTQEDDEEEKFDEQIAAETLDNEGQVLDTLDSLPSDESSNFENVDEEVMEDFGEDDEDINEGQAY